MESPGAEDMSMGGAMMRADMTQGAETGDDLLPAPASGEGGDDGGCSAVPRQSTHGRSTFGGLVALVLLGWVVLRRRQ